MNTPEPRQDDARLILAMDRITAIASDMGEVKSTLTKLTEAVTKLAIVEERQSADRQALARAFLEIERLASRVQSLEQVQPIQKQSSDFVQKFIAAAAAAAIGAVGGATWGIKQPPSPQSPAPAVSTGKP